MLSIWWDVVIGQTVCPRCVADVCIAGISATVTTERTIDDCSVRGSQLSISRIGLESGGIDTASCLMVGGASCLVVGGDSCLMVGVYCSVVSACIGKQ